MSEQMDFEMSFFFDFSQDGISTEISEIKTSRQDYWFRVQFICALQECLHEYLRDSPLEKSGVYIVSVFEDNEPTYVSFRFKDFNYWDKL